MRSLRRQGLGKCIVQASTFPSIPIQAALVDSPGSCKEGNQRDVKKKKKKTQERRPGCQAIRSHSRPLLSTGVESPPTAFPENLHHPHMGSPPPPPPTPTPRRLLASHLSGSAWLSTAQRRPHGALAAACTGHPHPGRICSWSARPPGPLPTEGQGVGHGAQTGSCARGRQGLEMSPRPHRALDAERWKPVHEGYCLAHSPLCLGQVHARPSSHLHTQLRWS